jgi:hypothetical protein
MSKWRPASVLSFVLSETDLWNLERRGGVFCEFHIVFDMRLCGFFIAFCA